MAVVHLDSIPQTFAAYNDIRTAGGGRQNSYVHSSNKPFSGNNGTTTPTPYRIGRIVNWNKSAVDNSPIDQKLNRFYFHYNPQSVTVNSQTNSAVRQADPNVGDPGTNANTAETLNFEFLLNRMPDVADIPDPDNFYMQKNSAATFGTLHDLYYLYGLINQNFDSPEIRDNEHPQTDTGYLIPVPVTIIFGEFFRFVGIISSISVTHAMFVPSSVSNATSAPLVPVLSYVSVSAYRTLTNSFTIPDGGTAPSPPHGASTNDIPNNLPPALPPGSRGGTTVPGAKPPIPSPAPHGLPPGVRGA